MPGCTGPHHVVPENVIAARYKLSGENKVFLVRIHKERYCVAVSEKEKEEHEDKRRRASCQKVLGSKAVTTKGEEELSFCDGKCVLANEMMRSMLKKKANEDARKEDQRSKEERAGSSNPRRPQFGGGDEKKEEKKRKEKGRRRDEDRDEEKAKGKKDDGSARREKEVREKGPLDENQNGAASVAQGWSRDNSTATR